MCYDKSWKSNWSWWKKEKEIIKNSYLKGFEKFQSLFCFYIFADSMEMIEKIYALLKSCDFKITTDTRKIEKGSVFFALKGDNFNGNTFALQALEKGARYVIVDEKISDDDRIILTGNVLQTLQQVANYHRKQMGAKIIGITGSNGKTTSKELIYVVLKEKYKVFATKGNLNNHIGVPLSLLSINPTDEFAIIEMGANHQKEIEQLCAIAEPDFGIINNIGKAHLEGFGGEEGVKKGKGEMYGFISHHKKSLFVNGDDALLMDMSNSIERMTYGQSKTNHTVGKIIDEKDLLRIEIEENTIIQTNLVGNYNFSNVLLAACIGKYFNVSLEAIKKGIENYHPTNSRSQLIKKESNTIILDAYNANPSSMKSALDNFQQSDFKNKIVILGDMFEMGIYEAQEHQLIIDQANSKKFESVILCGQAFYKLKSNFDNTFFFENTNDCKMAVEKFNFKNKTILIKGSRSMALEKLMEVIG
jgi:UDP-N-acetylmuramoyl-tripeptide--D-alanyl-D-alanine ligase